MSECSKLFSAGMFEAGDYTAAPSISTTVQANNECGTYGCEV